MRIKLLQGLVGDRFAFTKGDEVEWPDEADAKRLIEAGYAVAAGDKAPVLRPPAPKRESAAKAPPENAAKASAKKK